MYYYMLCWREDFKSYCEYDFSFDEESNEEDLNRFKLMVGEEKETVIRDFLGNQYTVMYKDGCDCYFDPLLMHEFILGAFYGDTPLEGAANEAAINDLSGKISDRYWALLQENNDINCYFDEAGEEHYSFSDSEDDEKYADLLVKEFPPNCFLSLLSDAEKKQFFVSSMIDRVVAIKMKRLVTDLF